MPKKNAATLTMLSVAVAMMVVGFDRSVYADSSASVVSRAVAPVFDAFRDALAVNATTQDGQSSVADRLIALGRIDAAGRDVMEKTNLMGFTSQQRQAISNVAWIEIRLHDRQNQLVLKSMIPAAGWFDQNIVGMKAANAAFLVVQHAVNDDSFMKEVLSRMKEDVGTSKIHGPNYAELLDRVQMQNKLPQTYGTQFACIANHWMLYRISSLSEADRLRKVAGFKTTVLEDIKYFSSMPPCVVPRG